MLRLQPPVFMQECPSPSSLNDMQAESVRRRGKCARPRHCGLPDEHIKRAALGSVAKKIPSVCRYLRIGALRRVAHRDLGLSSALSSRNKNSRSPDVGCG